jgi:hypothetical protein
MPDVVIPQRGRKKRSLLQSETTGEVRQLVARGATVAATAVIHSWIGPVVVLTELGVLLLRELISAAVVLIALLGSKRYSERAFLLLRQDMGVFLHQDKEGHPHPSSHAATPDAEDLVS